MIPHALTTEWPRETMGAGPVPEQKKAAPWMVANSCTS